MDPFWPNIHIATPCSSNAKHVTRCPLNPGLLPDLCDTHESKQRYFLFPDPRYIAERDETGKHDSVTCHRKVFVRLPEDDRCEVVKGIHAWRPQIILSRICLGEEEGFCLALLLFLCFLRGLFLLDKYLYFIWFLFIRRCLWWQYAHDYLHYCGIISGRKRFLFNGYSPFSIQVSIEVTTCRSEGGRRDFRDEPVLNPLQGYMQDIYMGLLFNVVKPNLCWGPLDNLLPRKYLLLLIFGKEMAFHRLVTSVTPILQR